ncbi:ATP-binding cassette domain-containing protein [Ruegeria sp. SCSIO 43209]|jgi:ABC-type branched-subunit amino acid transport system ATPase component|uniref:ABC transporter ATP-binding protein n=1 Tax=Ruegeria sp. SCSIO 43209 TaxID=2793010 RepID=UPI001480F3B8|nr:ATP-binding cassette domain-containing protein [Ruegeria sp. SCSIO 43209]UAB90582.1 ATP-binding cassette domain-containing protein [Ruegeria sp. SCSIO 43209]
MSVALQVSGLVKRFGGLVATNDLSFSLKEGESLGLIGPNGAGKTTVFSQIMGELRQNGGTIELFGQEISTLSTPQRIRAGVSRTYQIPRPFGDMSVAENIRVGLMPDNIWQMIVSPPDKERERELALSVGFTEADLKRAPTELAMGDLRKLEMARTMATAPKVMLLDEVFAGLTTGEIAQISDLIQSMRKDGMTFLIVSHDLPALEPLVDRAIAIERGTMIAEGSFSEVMNDKAVQASYLGGA